MSIRQAVKMTSYRISTTNQTELWTYSVTLLWSRDTEKSDLSPDFRRTDKFGGVGAASCYHSWGLLYRLMCSKNKHNRCARWTTGYDTTVECALVSLVYHTWPKIKNINKQESCAIAKMTARCALYKWIERAVAEIWPFEIIQDGGMPPTWILCDRK